MATPDLLQAASALLTGPTAVTSNLRHFGDAAERRRHETGRQTCYLRDQPPSAGQRNTGVLQPAPDSTSRRDMTTTSRPGWLAARGFLASLASLYG